jgi:glutamyl-tRNA reductase
MGRLCVIGLSHKSAPVEVRERAAFAEAALEAALKDLTARPGIGEAMIVSTCNRVELYAGVDSSGALDALHRFFVDERGLPAAFREHLYAHDGDEALRHLFRVASSLDSMVVGESQILGQVKQAFQTATAAGTVGPVLGRALPHAFQLAKRVRTETDIARSSASIASAAVSLAAQIFGDLRGREVLVVGAGKMGDLSARHLRAAGIGKLHVVNRTHARAVELAERLGGVPAPWEMLDWLLEHVDIVLCSTGAQEPVIREARVREAMRARKGRWLFFIDIAVPRDVEPAVGSVGNVYLYDVDALEQVVSANRAGRAREASEAEALVTEELKRYQALERTLGVVPVIKALRSRFLDVARAEAQRAAARGGGATEAQLAQFAEAIVNKLLHKPLTALKREAKESPEGGLLCEAVQALFELELTADEPVVVPLKSGEGER